MNKSSQSTPPPEIILIESDSVTLELYERELCKDFTIFSFTELKGVLEVVAARDIRAVVIEPEIDAKQGWDLIHNIHTEFPERSIPVIVCSTRDNCNKSASLEVAKYLTKPVLPRTLREKTLEIVQKKDFLLK
jgi:DNA-binding response OmpR family regulator